LSIVQSFPSALAVDVLIHCQVPRKDDRLSLPGWFTQMYRIVVVTL